MCPKRGGTQGRAREPLPRAELTFREREQPPPGSGAGGDGPVSPSEDVSSALRSVSRSQPALHGILVPPAAPAPGRAQVFPCPPPLPASSSGSLALLEEINPQQKLGRSVPPGRRAIPTPHLLTEMPLPLPPSPAASPAAAPRSSPAGDRSRERAQTPARRPDPEEFYKVIKYARDSTN